MSRLLVESGSFKVSDLAAATGLTRQGLHRHLQRAVEAGSIARVGEGRGTRYEAANAAAGSVDGFERQYSVHGLEPRTVWRDVAQWIAGRPGLRAPELLGVLEYAITQLVGNAVVHSGSEHVWVSASVVGERLRLDVADAGLGALERLRSELHLQDYFHSVQELSKGRTTTKAATHAGEGLFFVSKLGARFQLNANGLGWIVNNELDDQTVQQDSGGPGTRVHLGFDVRSSVSLRQVLDRFKSANVIDTTRCVVRLFEHGAEFFTRGQAERLTANLERFDLVELDFRSVESVGQAFVDAVFRDWANANPGTTLRPVHMSSSVEFMVHRGLPIS